ncbi:MAG: hypothetical protein IKE65_06910, partial [Clostridia bacterium]|nr:hypothetical protein [Clostridia bacterium]
TRVQTNFASDKGLRAEPLKIASFVSPSPKKFASQYFSGTSFFGKHRITASETSNITMGMRIRTF